MRVLVVCDWFLKYAASQSGALRRAGMEVFLLCRDHASEFGGSSEERQYVLRNVADGVALGVLPGRVSSPSAVRDVGRLRGLIRSWRPDVVHAHDNTDPRLLAIVGGLTRVTTVHDPVPHPGQPPLPRVEELVRRRWIRGSAAVVVHGTENAEALPAWSRPKARSGNTAWRCNTRSPPSASLIALRCFFSGGSSRTRESTSSSGDGESVGGEGRCKAHRRGSRPGGGARPRPPTHRAS